MRPAVAAVPDFDRLAVELPGVTDRRDPPVPVTVHLPLDDEHHDGVLHGWSRTATDDGALRGLVVVRGQYSPGFWTDYVGWVQAERIERRAPV